MLPLANDMQTIQSVRQSDVIQLATNKQTTENLRQKPTSIKYHNRLQLEAGQYLRWATHVRINRQMDVKNNASVATG